MGQQKIMQPLGTKNNHALNRSNCVQISSKGTVKCKKMHMVKIHNKDICPDIYVNSWEEEISTTVVGEKGLKDQFRGKVTKYRKKRTNNAIGTVKNTNIT